MNQEVGGVRAQEPFACKEKTHEKIAHEPVVEGPEAAVARKNGRKRGGAVDEEEDAPDDGDLSAPAHAFGRKVRVPHAGEAFDQGARLEAPRKEDESERVNEYWVEEERFIALGRKAERREKKGERGGTERHGVAREDGAAERHEGEKSRHRRHAPVRKAPVGPEGVEERQKRKKGTRRDGCPFRRRFPLRHASGGGFVEHPRDHAHDVAERLDGFEVFGREALAGASARSCRRRRSSRCRSLRREARPNEVFRRGFQSRP